MVTAPTAQNRTKSRGDRRFHAAAFVAEDRLTNSAIAERVGVSLRQLMTWKTEPEFQSLVRDNEAELRAVAMRYPVAKQRDRMHRLNDRWERAHRLIEARAESIGDAVPGGDTGLLAEQVKVAASGATVSDYAADVALLREIREMEKQAAIECSQWAEKREITGKDGGPIRIAPPGFDWDSYATAFSGALGLEPPPARSDGAQQPVDTASTDG